MFSIEPELPSDGAAIEHLLDIAFGPGRHAKSAYRLREGVGPIASLGFVARANGVVQGSIRYWPIRIGAATEIMLGPLAVDPALRGQGIGIGLMIVSLARARAQGHRLVMLVGDEPYYARVGFRAVRRGQFVFPGPVDERRLLARELAPGVLETLSGAILPCRDGAAPSAALAAPGKNDKPAKKHEGEKRRKKRAL